MTVSLRCSGLMNAFNSALMGTGIVNDTITVANYFDHETCEMMNDKLRVLDRVQEKNFERLIDAHCGLFILFVDKLHRFYHKIRVVFQF